MIGLITDNNETAYRERGEYPDKMVSGEPPLTQHRQDQGAGGGLQETEQRTHTLTIDKTPVERVSSFKFLGVSHHRGSHMVCSHRCSAEEGTSASLLPETAEEVWNEPQNPQVLLHLHRESSLTGCITTWFGNSNRWQPQGSAKGRANCPPHCWR